MTSGDISTYFLSPEYRINAAPAECIREEKKKPDAQWHVYELAHALGGARVMDVGCGDGAMLMEFFSGATTLGHDIAPNIALCREAYPVRSWDVLDLDAPFRLSGGYDLILCADVIEHLRHPEHLLTELARLNRRFHASIVLSTPERDLKRGPNHLGPPPNPMHVREWAQPEFLALLRWFGLDPQFRLVPSSRSSEIGNSTLVAICASP